MMSLPVCDELVGIILCSFINVTETDIFGDLKVLVCPEGMVILRQAEDESEKRHPKGKWRRLELLCIKPMSVTPRRRTRSRP